MEDRLISFGKATIVNLLLFVGFICSAQVSSSEWRSLGLTSEMAVGAKGNAVEKALKEGMRKEQLKQQAQANAERAYDATVAAGVSAIAAANIMNNDLNYMQVEEFMDRTHVTVDNRPSITDPVNLRDRYDSDSRTSVISESLWGRNASPGIAHILMQYDIETIKQDLIPSLRQRLLENYETLRKAVPGSEEAISLEKDIWVSEEDLRDFEDAVNASDRSSSWGQSMPPLEFEHEKGTVVYSREVAEDSLVPMSENEFLSYCQSAADGVEKMYSNYSDYYMAQSSEIVDGKLITRIFFTNIQPTGRPSVSSVQDGSDVPLYSEAEKAKLLNDIDEELASKKYELVKKLRTIEAYEQYQASLEKDITSNNVYILDNLAQVVKKEVHISFSKVVPVTAPMGVEKIIEPVEKAVNDKIAGYIDAGAQRPYDDFDVKPNQSSTKKLAALDAAEQGYEDMNRAFNYVKKFVNAAGNVDKDIPKEFEKAIKALDKSLGYVPSKVKGAVGKYMFFIKNRYEIGSSIGLGAADITIYSMKNENREFLRQKKEEAQQLRDDIKRLQDRHDYIAQ